MPGIVQRPHLRGEEARGERALVGRDADAPVRTAAHQEHRRTPGGEYVGDGAVWRGRAPDVVERGRPPAEELQAPPRTGDDTRQAARPGALENRDRTHRIAAPQVGVGGPPGDGRELGQGLHDPVPAGTVLDRGVDHREAVIVGRSRLRPAVKLGEQGAELRAGERRVVRAGRRVHEVARGRDRVGSVQPRPEQPLRGHRRQPGELGPGCGIAARSRLGEQRP